jgi:sulfate/thiosulfate transport system permease protein
VKGKKMLFTNKNRGVIPGFGLTLGYTILYLSLIVIIPLSAVVFKTTSLSWGAFWETVTSPRVMASYRLTFSVSIAAALLDGIFGVMTAWVLVRYRLPGNA